MRNSTELRRFPSPHPSLFSGFFVDFLRSNEEGMRGEALYKGGLTRSPWGGRPPLSPAWWATGPPAGPPCWSPEGWATGACRPLGGNRPPLFFLQEFCCKFEGKKLHLSPKIPQKIQKKERGEEKKSGEALPDSALVICRLVHLVYVFFHWYCRVI